MRFVARVREQRKKDGYGRILPRARWLLWNWPENITEHQARKLKKILQDNLKSLPHYIT